MKKNSHFPGILSSIFLIFFLYLVMGILGAIHSLILPALVPSFKAENSFLSIAVISSISYFTVIYTGYRLSARSFHAAFPFRSISPVFLFCMSFLSTGMVILTYRMDSFIDKNIPIPEIFYVLLNELLGDKSFPELFFLVCIMAPVTEEFLFRGVIYSGLRSRYSSRIAITVSAVLFSLFHGNPLQIPGAFAAGIALAWIQEKSGNLFYSIYFHSSFNLFSLFLILSDEKEEFVFFKYFTEDLNEFRLIIYGIAILIAGVILSHLYLNKFSATKEGNDA